MPKPDIQQDEPSEARLQEAHCRVLQRIKAYSFCRGFGLITEHWDPGVNGGREGGGGVWAGAEWVAAQPIMGFFVCLLV